MKIVFSSLTMSRSAMILIASLLLGGCLETETTTVVHSDGSLTRSVTIKGDSSSLTSGIQMFRIDSAWTVEHFPVKQRERTLVASRTYSSAEAMSEALAGAPGRQIDIKPRLTRTFYWFFTTYRYEETWSKLNPTDVVPVSEYLSKAEIDAFALRISGPKSVLSGSDSLASEESSERFNAWNSRNSFEEYFRLFKQGIRLLADPRLTEAMAEGQKERCFTKARRFDWTSGNLEELEQQFAEILGTPLVRRALDANRSNIEAFRSRLDFQQRVLTSSHKVHVVVPGIVTATNAGDVEGSRVTWESFITMAYVGDYTLWVESREVHGWAVAISGIAVLGIVGMGIFAVFRRRRQGQK